MDLNAVTQRYRTHTELPGDVDFILLSYTPLVKKYTDLLTGRFRCYGDRPLLSDKNILYFAQALTRYGDKSRTLWWAIKKCTAIGRDVIEVEVQATLLQCFRDRGWVKHFPTVLAKNVAELLGSAKDILYCELSQYRDLKVSLDSDFFRKVAPQISRAEELFDERRITITARERDVLRALGEDYNFAAAGRALGISRQRVRRIMKRLQEKAELG